MQHHHGEQRKAERQQVSVQQQDADVHEIKAEERRVAAEGVNAGGDQLRLVLVGDPRPPAVLHAKDRQQKDGVAQHPDAEAGEPRVRGKVAPAESDGEQLRNGRAQRGQAHQHLDGVDVFFPSASDLPGLDAAPLLREHLGKINAVEHRQHEQRQRRAGELVLPWNFHASSVLSAACAVQTGRPQCSKSHGSI